MEQASFVFFGAIVALILGVPILALFEYFLFKYGQKLAVQIPNRISNNRGILAISLLFVPTSALAMIIPGDPFFKLFYWVFFYLLCGYPCVIGFVSKRQTMEILATKTFRKNVDHWLSEWECETKGDEVADDWNSIFNEQNRDRGE